MPLPIRPLGCVLGQKEKKEEKKREGVSLLLLLYLVGDTVFHPPSSLISIVYPLAHHLACSLRIATSCETRLDRTAILNRATPNNVLFMIMFLLEIYDGKKKKRRLRGKGVPETTLRGCGEGLREDAGFFQSSDLFRCHILQWIDRTKSFRQAFCRNRISWRRCRSWLRSGCFLHC